MASAVCTVMHVPFHIKQGSGACLASTHFIVKSFYHFLMETFLHRVQEGLYFPELKSKMNSHSKDVLRCNPQKKMSDTCIGYNLQRASLFTGFYWQNKRMRGRVRDGSCEAKIQ